MFQNLVLHYPPQLRAFFGGIAGLKLMWRENATFGTAKRGPLVLGGCQSDGTLIRSGRGRIEQRFLVTQGFLEECALIRYAAGKTSNLPASSIFALGKMHICGNGWRRKGAAAPMQNAQQSFNARSALADDDSRSEAAMSSTGSPNHTVSSCSPKNKLLTIPTILTLARVAAVPAILAVFYCKETWATAAGVAIFVLAAVTDWLDGYLARKMGSSSAFGAFLDPVADKLMVATALVLLCTRPLPVSGLATTSWLLPLPTIAIIGREITMSAVREWAAAQGADVLKAVAVNNLGKIKTASQMVAITLLLATRDGGLDSAIASHVGIILLYAAAGLALWSLGIYMKGIWGSLSK